MNHPTSIVHASITDARMFYALRRAGHARDVAHDYAILYERTGANLRGLQALLRSGK